MKVSCFILIFLFSLLIFNASFMCIRFEKTISIDSIRYFKPDQIRIRSTYFKASQLQLQLKDGWHTFVKDTITNLFKANKDEKNDYILLSFTTTSLEKTFLTGTIDYQSFDKKRGNNTSKVFHLKQVKIPLNDLKSFNVTYDAYDKAFGIKKVSK